jgi:hypothetical protein
MMATNNVIRLILVAAALALVARSAGAAPAAELVLRLHDSQGHASTYRVAVDPARFADGAASPTELADHLTRAKSRMADELGYTARIHGRDHYKVLGAVRVAGAWVEKDGRRTALGFFRSEPTE